MTGVDDGAGDTTRFDALLRSLLSFGLVRRAEGEAGWCLSAAAQSRLDHLGAPVPVTDDLLYFGHRCAVCGEHRPTHRRSGAYVCDACAAAARDRRS